MRAATLFFVVVATAACHHDTPPAQSAPPAQTAAPAATVNATGAMPVGSIKEDRGDIRYVNPTLQPPARSDAGTAH